MYVKPSLSEYDLISEFNMLIADGLWGEAKFQEHESAPFAVLVSEIDN